MSPNACSGAGSECGSPRATRGATILSSRSPRRVSSAFCTPSSPQKISSLCSPGIGASQRTRPGVSESLSGVPVVVSGPTRELLAVVNLGMGRLEAMLIVLDKSSKGAQAYLALAGEKPASICLINNAAVARPVGVLGTLDDADAATSLAVNLAAPIALANLFCRVFTADGVARRIINVSSGAAQRALPGETMYCVTKAGLEMLTASLAAEQQGPDFQSISVRPGIIDTDMQAFARSQSRDVLPSVDLFQGFYFARPIGNVAIWAGKLAGVWLQAVLSADPDQGQRRHRRQDGHQRRIARAGEVDLQRRPVVVHTGGSEYFCKLIENGFEPYYVVDASSSNTNVTMTNDSTKMTCQVSLRNLTIIGDSSKKIKICNKYIGNQTGAEPTSNGSGGAVMMAGPTGGPGAPAAAIATIPVAMR